MNKEKIQEKLKKIKALAEQGVGGEKEGAIDLYHKLLAKYEISEEEIIEEHIERRWFRYDNELDKKLMTQIFYKVTGSPNYFEKTDKRRRMIGCESTDFELDQIIFYYRFYSEHMKAEIEEFTVAFFSVNSLFPDETTRCYEEPQDLSKSKQRSLEDILAIDAMASGMKRKIPNLQLEDKNKDT